MKKSKSVLLLGATGLVGSKCSDLLINDNEIERVELLTRREIPGLNTPKVNQHIIDFDKIHEHKNLIDTDVVICALGTTIKKAGSRLNFYKVDHQYPVSVAEIAKENGTSHFIVVTSMGADTNSRIFYNRVKGEVELALHELKFKTLTILRPSMLLGKRGEERSGEKLGKILMKTFDFLIPSKYKAVNAEKVASAAVEFSKNDLPGENIIESDQLQKY